MDQGLNKYSYQVHTFGCKVNSYDSGLLQKNLSKSGLFDFKKIDQAQVHILNTCAVTAEATKEAVKLIRKIKTKNPLSTVVVTGCSAQVDTGIFEALPGADLIIANSHKMAMGQIIDDFFKGKVQNKVFKSNIFKKDDLEEGGGTEATHTRSFLKIQDGCNSFCTFCVIPFARGKSRSLSVDALVSRVNALQEQGHREVVLTGVHIGDYEDESQGLKRGLEDLVENLLLKTKIQRFRLSSLEPIEITERLLDLYSDPRLCPHFHVSLQSANTEVLAQMKRKYTQEQVVYALNRIQQKVPGAFVGLDVIAGFPTETHEQFEDTYLCLADNPWTRIHVFPYSERPGTRAAAFDDTVEWSERKRRASRLRELSLSRFDSLAAQQVKTKKKVLLLRNNKNHLMAISRDYWNVQIEQERVLSEADYLKEWEVEISDYTHRLASRTSAQDGLLISKELIP
jgi:threonylcarbamoyladenosine tRNA methylthiotransferase MtaB